MKDIGRKLTARRAAPARQRIAPAPAAPPVASVHAPVQVETNEASPPALCEPCETEWAAFTPDDIAELLIQAGRFPEERREFLLSLPRDRLVAVFCGCAAQLRFAPPLTAAAPRPRSSVR